MGSLLIVDDEPPVRSLFRAVLEMEGWIVDEAVDGVDAIRVLEELDGVVDMVLLDMMMPRMNGLELLEHMAEHPAWSKIPRVVISAKDSPGEQATAGRLGAAAWLVKPVSPDRLVDAVEDWTSDVSAFEV